MSFYDNMSGSEDGQLRSPNDEQYMSVDEEERDGDSLDIKPPQARTSYTRDGISGGARRKEKKHSKERKHKERISSGPRDEHPHRRESGSDREPRRSDIERRDYRRDERNEVMERYQQRNDREILTSNDRRYQKHGNHHIYHYQQQQQHHHHSQPPPPPQQSAYAHHHHHHQSVLHMQVRSQRHDYYHPDYHNSRQSHHHSQAFDKHLNEYPVDLDMSRDTRRYKYGYEQQKDAESLEQDLRTRLLSKRHKYVKDYEVDEKYERGERSDLRRKERHRDDENERERAVLKAERQKQRREKERALHNVIEVLDSPDLTSSTQHRRKNKHRNRERNVEEQLKIKSPDDPELLARRAKLLAAEREKEKRKEELEARREMLRERIEHNGALSPSAVAASVTAGLNVVKRKQRSHEEEKRRKQSKRSKHVSDEDDDEEEEDDDNDNDENSGSDTASDNSDKSESESAESEDSYKVKKKRKQKSKTKRNTHVEIDDDDEELPLPDSPLSIGALYKSPKHKTKSLDGNNHPHVSSRSRSRSSRSRSHSSHSSRHSSRSTHSRSRSGSQSRSRSRTGSSSERSNRSKRDSRSRSVSSGTRSEERGMSEQQTKSNDEDVLKKQATSTKKEIPEEAVPCDEKGVPLPNYYPGVQGCRSVEEFQCLNRIEEGTYGVVYRAKDKRTNEIVALKRLKMEKEKEGFPITSLREINTLLKGQHPNIVTVREIVVGSNMDKIFIVMDYVEHDLKSLMETMKQRKQSFFPGEVKCLTQQLLLAVGHLHDNWILHRDLKTSNLLLSHKGVLKVGDFGLAREYGSPLKKYTSLVVTLWYRAPELLLCSPEYSTPIDIWSVGCIFAEFLQMSPLFPGKSEIDELNKIFKELGTPNEKIWPGYKELPAVKNMLSQNSQFTEYPVSQLRKHFIDKTTETGIALLQGLLTYDPKQRLNADAALKHPYFKELPLPIDPSMFPTWPAKSELGARKGTSPKPPSGGSQFKQLGRDEVASTSAAGAKPTSGIITGNKKTAANTGFVLNAGLTQRQLAMGPGFSLKF